jgi:hypothetical protein
MHAGELPGIDGACIIMEHLDLSVRTLQLLV